MGLKRFDNKLPEKKKNFKQISIVLCICLIAVLSFTSYAIYQVRHEKPIVNSKVGEFNKLSLVVMVDGAENETLPKKEEGKIFEKIECDNEGQAEWDNENWELTNIVANKPTLCTISFVTPLEEDASRAEAPDLNNGLIPVMYENQKWVKADATQKWYDYDTQWWANAVTVSSATRNTYTNASAGTEVKMTDIETMWVWVPRYEYQHTNLSIQYAGGTQTLPGGITINFISKNTTTPSSDNYTIHDAFWWDDNNDGVKDANEQLSGIWVAKFEMSTGTTTCTPSLNSSPGYGCNLSTITPQIKPNATSWRGAQIGTFWTVIHNNMNGTDNTYGLINSDTHLMKNMEWGAVAYLSQSKYGKYGNSNYTEANKEIYINNNSSYYTGRSKGLTSANGTYSYDGRSCTTATCNTETIDKTSEGYGASTTGTIYGIYDMSGGALEYVMGIMKESTNTELEVGASQSYNSGWSGKLYDETEYTGKYGDLKDIGRKYYDLYSYSTSNDDASIRYHKGDATYETQGWYSDRTLFVNQSTPFFLRGGEVSNRSNAGVFNFSRSYGYANAVFGGRPVVVSVN